MRLASTLTRLASRGLPSTDTPPVPAAADWAAALSALHAQNDDALFLVSGFWWVTKRNVSTEGRAFDNSARVPALSGSLVIKADGTRFEQDCYTTPNSPSCGWRGLSYKLCHGDTAAQRIISDAMNSLVDLGATLVSMDQEIGGGMSESGCWGGDGADGGAHAHNPGFGAWMFEGFNATLARTAAHARGAAQPLGLLTEQTSELLIPSVASAYSRQFAQFYWPWNNALGGRSPGLYSYLYHEYLPVFAAEFSQGRGTGSPDFHVQRTLFANALTRGLVPLYGAWDVSIDSKNPWQVNNTVAAAAYARVPRNWLPVLIYGETVRPPPVAVADIASWVLDPAGNRVDVALPSVIAGAFRGAPAPGAPDALFAIFSSIVDGDVFFSAELAGWGGGVTTLYDAATRAQIAQWPSVPSAINHTITDSCASVVVVVENALRGKARRVVRASHERRALGGL